MPSLSQVAGALLACKPSISGLECDFGSIKDVISPKRAFISQVFVEIEMMLKLNKSLIESDPDKVAKLKRYPALMTCQKKMSQMKRSTIQLKKRQ
jgi:hypothetical protein